MEANGSASDWIELDWIGLTAHIRMEQVQVDNETSDWQFLAALRTMGLSLGITPCSYTKTGWPSPAKGYPAVRCDAS
jgi:hypothetical protein